jgi:ABC-type microcin C transport system duplicated ATPase subunit YejF
VCKRFRAGVDPYGRPVEVVAAEEVDIWVMPAECIAIVGESGSGKSTLLRLALGLLDPDDGRVMLFGENLQRLDSRERRRLRASVGVVFQEPFESLNPRQRVRDIISEPLRLHEKDLSRAERRERVEQALAEVTLSTAVLDKLPAEMSGGQQQRVGIARAIVRKPLLLLLDEPTSAVDVSVQAQILQILSHLRSSLHCALVLVTHDIGVAASLSDRIVVMHDGRVREEGPAPQLLDSPADEYTAELLAAGLAGLPTLFDKEETDAGPH